MKTKRNYSKEFEEAVGDDGDYEDNDKEEDGLMETNFDENPHVFVKRSYSSLTGYSFENEETKIGKTFQTRNVKFLFDKLLLEDECGNPKFINYLIKTQDFEIQKTASDSFVGVVKYEFEYYGKPYTNENGVKVRPARNFKTTYGEIADPNEMNIIVDDIRYHYDNWKSQEFNKIIKKAGIATGIELTIIALVTGLSLGLKRIGKDTERNASVKWEKLTPAEKRRIISWIKLEKASGKTVYEFGKYFPFILSASVLYGLTMRKRKKKFL